jgi:DnaJ-class molecular chaperone
MGKSEAGKGDSPRPFSISIKKFDDNFDLWFPNAKKRVKNCKECDGEGRYIDPSHGCSRKCKTCNGTGIETI